MGQLMLYVSILLSLAISIDGQCTLPAQWISSFTGNKQLWGERPKTIDTVDEWEFWTFDNDNLLTDLSSNTRYVCQSSQIDPLTGFTKLFYLKTGGIPMCFYGKISSIDSSNKVMFYKKSVESTSNPPTSLADCDTQTGIAGGIYTIFIRVSLKGWTYTHVFTTIPDGTYQLRIQKGDASVECTGDSTSTFTKSQNKITVNSPCISTTDTSYGNPFGQELMITDSITDIQLGLGETGTSGFLVMNNEKSATVNSQTSVYAFRFYIARYAIENGALTMYMETNAPDLRPAGYWNDIAPVDRQPISIWLQTTQCLTNTAFCSHGGTCMAGFTEAICHCTQHFEGNTCQITVDKCNPNPCLLSGVCTQTGTDYSCQCTAGRAGTNCELVDKCVGTGALTCSNGGTCHTYRDNNNLDAGWCSCVAPYSGDTCLTFNPCLNTPCQNIGECVAKENAADSTDYLCRCTSGTYGDNCELIGPGPCANDPCGEGAMSCDVIGSNFICHCKPGYSGDTCQSVGSCTVNPCKNDGVCNAVGDGVYCECTSYYTGAFCEDYRDWFIILLVLVILTAIILVILILVCACYCCCGWRPGSNKTPYEAYADQTGAVSAYSAPAEPIGDTVQFNFVPLSQYQGITTTR